MSAKLVLDTAAMQEDFFADTALVGIVSALPVYRFCWLINQRMDMDFVREPDLDIIFQSTPQQKHYFPIYQYCLPLHGSRYSIYKLKTDKEVLLPEVKQLDYLWMVQSAAPDDDALDIIHHLRNIPDVQLAQTLSPDRLKHLSHLLL